MDQEDLKFSINISPTLSRADTLQGLLLEAYYSTHETPQIRSYDDLLRQVADLLANDPQDDARPIQILYAFFVKVSADEAAMEKTMQDLGQYMLRLYSLPFAHIEHVLNHVMKRIVAMGRLRTMQANPYTTRHALNNYASAQHTNRYGGHIDRYA